MNHTLQFKLVFITLIMLFSASCNGNNDKISENNEVVGIVEESDPYNYIASVGSQDISISGSEFQVKTDNCGASLNAKETLSRSRSFDIRLEADVATSLGSEFKGDILVAGAKVQTAIETSLGIQVGTTETVNAERELETPADSISTITLQWEEVWNTGNVNIINDAGELEGKIPFRILTTLRLSQKSVDEVPCATATPTVSAKVTNTQTPPTETPKPPTSVPTNTPKPTSTQTATPKPSSTLTPTPRPTLTETPLPGGIGTGIIDEGFQVILTNYEFRSMSNTSDEAPVEISLKFVNDTDSESTIEINWLLLEFDF